MAFVVLFSTMSFTIDMHYCGDKLVETAIFNKAKGCGMEMDNPSAEGCAITKKNCCNDEQLIVDGQDELNFNEWDALSDRRKKSKLKTKRILLRKRKNNVSSTYIPSYRTT